MLEKTSDAAIQARAASILRKRGGRIEQYLPNNAMSFQATGDSVWFNDEELGHGMDNIVFANRYMRRWDIPTFVKVLRHADRSSKRPARSI